MRAREFTINVPINIKIDGDGDPQVSSGNEMGAFASLTQQKLDLLKQLANGEQNAEPVNEPFSQPIQQPVARQQPQRDADDEEVGTFVPPLQQKIELMKHAAGKQGPVIDQIVADDDNEAS